MDYNAFEQLVQNVKGRYFAGGKRDTINKSSGPFTPEQIYRLVGQFTGGGDRTCVLKDLHNAQRIMPMLSTGAEPIIKMGIYAGQKRDNLKILAPHIVDRQDVTARNNICHIFEGSDRMWAMKTLDEAGPYNGPLPPGVAYATGSTVTVVTPMQTQNPVAYVANNMGTSLFGGIFTANVATTRMPIASTVTYYTPPQAGVQQFNYPGMGGVQPGYNYQPQTNLPAYPNPPVPKEGVPSDPPPAYTPVYPHLPPQNNAMSSPPPTNYGSAPPSEPPYAGSPYPEKS